MSTVTSRTIDVLSNGEPTAAGRHPDQRPRTATDRRWMPGAVVAVVALFAVTLALFGSRTSPGVSSDSIDYISGARNLARDGLYVDYASKPITLFPPGFPLTLAAGDTIGVDPVDGARWLNALAFGALVVLMFVLARRHVRVWLAVGASAALALAPGSFGVFTFVWTEPVFCVLTVAMILALEPLMMSRGRDRKFMVLVGVLGATAFLYRYAGVVLVVLPTLIIAVGARRDGFAAIVRRVGAYSALAVIVPVVVVARNLSHGTDALGPRASSLESPASVARDLMDSWRSWLVDSRAPSVVAYLVLAGVVAVVATGVWIALRSRRTKTGSDERRVHDTTMFPLAAFVVGYLAYLVVSELVTNVDVLDVRLLAPVLAPAVVLVTVAVERILQFDWAIGGRWIPRVVVGAFAVWLIASLATSVDRARTDGAAGQRFAADSWRGSALVSAVEQLDHDAVIYSNVANGIYYASGRQPISPSPASHFYRSADTRNELPLFQREVEQAGSAFLAWQPEYGSGWVSPADLRRRGFDVELVAKTADGAIYAVRTAAHSEDTAPSSPDG